MLKMASWILLLVVGLLIILGSLGSMGIAYWGDAANDIITPSTSLAELDLDSEVSAALRGRRGTAAAFGFAFVTLYLFVVLGPYRKGEIWAWWALLSSIVVLLVALALRIPALGMSQGVSTGLSLLVAVVIGLLLDIQRLKR